MNLYQDRQQILEERPDRSGAGGRGPAQTGGDAPENGVGPDIESLDAALDVFLSEDSAAVTELESPPREMPGAAAFHTFDSPRPEPSVPRPLETERPKPRPGTQLTATAWLRDAELEPAGAEIGTPGAQLPNESDPARITWASRALQAAARALAALGSLVEGAAASVWRRIVWPRPGSRVAVSMAVGIAVTILAFVVWRSLTVGPIGASGLLTLTSRPAGATVLIDGEPRGTTPATIRTTVGSHVIEVRSAGPTQVVSLWVGDGRRISRYFDLPVGTAAARLEVNTRPSGAAVSVDGRARGKSPLLVEDLTPGPHRIRVTRDTQSLERTVMMESGANGAVNLTFPTPARLPPRRGLLTVSIPIEVRAFENGTSIGTTRAMPWELTAGRHELEFVNEALGVHERKSVDIVEGRVQGLEIAVAPGTLSIASPDAAAILIDGQPVGSGPVVKHRVIAGQHDVVARHPVLGERRLLVTVLPGGAVDVTITLDR